MDVGDSQREMSRFVSAVDRLDGSNNQRENYPRLAYGPVSGGNLHLN